MSISQYSPDGKFQAGSFMNGMWSGPQGTNPNQGLMGLGQQPQQGQPQGMAPPTSPFGGAGVNFNIPNGQPQPMPSPQYPTENQQWVMGSNSDNGSYQPSTKFLDPNPIAPSNNGQLKYDSGDNVMPQGYQQPTLNQMDDGSNYINGMYSPKGVSWMSNPESAMLGGDMGVTIYKQPDGTYLDSSGKPTDYSQYNQRIDWTQNRFNPTQQPQGTTPALRPTPQPPQIFQPQPMQQQPSNPVNTQTVQPNFMGQTPFGQAQTGQFTSTNPFVQAAQANAQGNIAGALQATAANRINQQTPYGSLSYQQTGTDAQGNPIWSANQQLSPELQQLTQSSLAGLQASQANPMYGINPGDTYSNAIMQRLAPQQSQAREALDAQLANQGIMPGSEAYNRAKVLQGQTQNDALTSAIVGGMNTGLQAQGLQNTTAANIRNLATPGYVTPYNQAAVAGPDYLSAYTSQNATDIARANAEAAQRSSLLSGLAGLGSSAILGGTGANSALGGLLGLGTAGANALGNTSLWNSLFGGNTSTNPNAIFDVAGGGINNVQPDWWSSLSFD